jgi:hypothetical protein
MLHRPGSNRLHPNAQFASDFDRVRRSGLRDGRLLVTRTAATQSFTRDPTDLATPIPDTFEGDDDAGLEHADLSKESLPHFQSFPDKRFSNQ